MKNLLKGRIEGKRRCRCACKLAKAEIWCLGEACKPSHSTWDSYSRWPTFVGRCRLVRPMSSSFFKLTWEFNVCYCWIPVEIFVWWVGGCLESEGLKLQRWMSTSPYFKILTYFIIMSRSIRILIYKDGNLQVTFYKLINNGVLIFPLLLWKLTGRQLLLLTVRFLMWLTDNILLKICEKGNLLVIYLSNIRVSSCQLIV